jgi:hypothetical protein
MVCTFAHAVIRPFDVLVGINNEDLSKLTFDSAIEVIRQSAWPRTLHFMRDLSAPVMEQSIKEGCVVRANFMCSELRDNSII